MAHLAACAAAGRHAGAVGSPGQGSLPAVPLLRGTRLGMAGSRLTPLPSAAAFGTTSSARPGSPQCGLPAGGGGGGGAGGGGGDDDGAPASAAPAALLVRPDNVTVTVGLSLPVLCASLAACFGATVWLVQQLLEPLKVQLAPLNKFVADFDEKQMKPLKEELKELKEELKKELKEELAPVKQFVAEFDEQKMKPLIDRLDKTDRDCETVKHTAFGRRLLRSWVGKPLRQRSAILARLDAVQELAEQGNSHPVLSCLAPTLRKLPDLERAVTPAFHGTIRPADLSAMLQQFSRLHQQLGVAADLTSGRAAAAAAKEPAATGWPLIGSGGGGSSLGGTQEAAAAVLALPVNLQGVRSEMLQQLLRAAADLSVAAVAEQLPSSCWAAAGQLGSAGSCCQRQEQAAEVGDGGSGSPCHAACLSHTCCLVLASVVQPPPHPAPMTIKLYICC